MTALIDQLDCLSPAELRRVSYAVNERLCAQPKNQRTLYDMLGFVGVVMRLGDEQKWEAEKREQLSAPTQPEQP